MFVVALVVVVVVAAAVVVLGVVLVQAISFCPSTSSS